MRPKQSDFIVVGTDTDAGKTTFSMLFLAAFADEYAYWKPLETGPSDTEAIRAAVPGATVHPPVMRFDEAIAPPFAAARAKTKIPSAKSLIDAKPKSDRPLIIETFGGPLSPLNQNEAQIEFIRGLGLPCVLVTQSTVGAVGRTRMCLQVLKLAGVRVACVVIVGQTDPFATVELLRDAHTVSLTPPTYWSDSGVREASDLQRAALNTIREMLADEPVPDNWQGRDELHVWHPYTPLVGAADPLVFVGAKDEFLELADGARLIDGISSWWTILHGHREPRLMAALHRAVERLDHVHFAGATHPPAIECAELLNARAPWSDGRVFFSDNGSTAVEVALKMAYQHWCHRGEPDRRIFVGFDNGYHGDTFGAMAVGRDPTFFGTFDPLLFEARRIPIDPDALDRTLSKDRVAAVIIEPLLQAAGGMRMHAPETLRQLWEVAQRHGVPFIADEVMTACRTGRFFAFEAAGIVPDLIPIAKTIAGGSMPLAATLVSPGILASFDTPDRSKTFFHGHSFTAHPLACAVAVENLRMLQTGAWIDDSNRIEHFWIANRDRFTGASDVRVCGTIIAMDVPSSGGYLADVAAPMREAARREGVLLRPLGNVLYCLPPLRTSDASLERIAVAMQAAIAAAGKLP